MRVLVIDPHRPERETTQRLLAADAHEVQVAPDVASAMKLLETHGFDVVLVESTMTGVTGNELVKRVRAREASGHLYVIMTAARLLPGDVKTAFASGVDDFIRKPMSRDELSARVEAPARIRRWAARVLVGAVGGGKGQASALTQIAAWTSLDASICAELSDMVGSPLAPMSASDPLDGAKFIASMPLSVPTEMAEVRLAIGIDDAASAALAEIMFGSPVAEPEMVKDMLREIANVSAGAFKRMAASEGRAFTTGLPTETDVTGFRSPAPLARRQWIGEVEGTPIRLRFEVELRVREPSRVRASALREGMVVAVDVRSTSGALLVRAGTRITESHLDGLCNVLGREAPVEVIEAA